jgi:hypothetical protein
VYLRYKRGRDEWRRFPRRRSFGHRRLTTPSGFGRQDGATLAGKQSSKFLYRPGTARQVECTGYGLYPVPRTGYDSVRSGAPDMVVISGAPDVGAATSGAVHRIGCSGAISGALCSRSCHRTGFSSHIRCTGCGSCHIRCGAPDRVQWCHIRCAAL